MQNHFLLLCFLLCFTVSNSQTKISFKQKDQSTVEINFANNFSTLEIKNSQTKKTQIINNIEASVTGKESHLETADYNFDGHPDFTYYHSDDGMGVYSIYQIFIFNSKTKNFELLKFPESSNAKCDMFCDVKVDKTKKTLSSSCRGGARWHTDVWKFDKNKKLILVK
ncbi:XAC2610-related protein [Flavobacterium artemisiae]|uniref:XAC2610-related protein n=1 Tax=Flavobacterium artemisiae TaxID=2126556 RepID=A0ABW4H7Z5_9FLAO